MERQRLVEMQGITKIFPGGVRANDSIDLTLYAGEIHALLGENGSGKSTLMSVLCGLYQPTSGVIQINGKETHFSSPADAIQAGIGMVHQHFKLVESLSVTENILLSESRGSFLLDLPKEGEKVAELGRKYGLTVKPDAKIWQLSMGEKQQVEILRALYQGSKVIILDEPTAVLTPAETKSLFEYLRFLAADGHGIVFISHKMAEIQALCDRVTVLRAGRVSGGFDQPPFSATELVRLMVDREVSSQLSRVEAQENPAEALRIENFHVQGDRGPLAVNDLNLTLYEGEIYAVAGVAGNGQRELVESLSGMRPAQSGKVFLYGQDVTHLDVKGRLKRGLSYVPGDRLGTGLVPSMTVLENLMLKNYKDPEFSDHYLLNYRAIETKAAEWVEEYRVKLASLHQPIRALSGGNQQKLLLAREIATEPRVMVIAYPARGLDLGAAADIYRILLELRNRGTAILILSEDLEEIFKVADRVGVMSDGKISGEFPIIDADVDRIGALMSGEKEEQNREYPI